MEEKREKTSMRSHWNEQQKAVVFLAQGDWSQNPLQPQSEPL